MTAQMFAGNIASPMQLLIILLIVLIFFGGSRLRNLGGDLGGAIKGFKKAMSEGDKEKEQEKLRADEHKIIDGVVQKDNVTSEKRSAEVTTYRHPLRDDDSQFNTL